MTVPAALRFLGEQAGVSLILVSRRMRFAPLLASHASNPRLSIVHAKKSSAWMNRRRSAPATRRDSSMRVAINQVKNGDADACVSAGNGP